MVGPWGCLFWAVYGPVGLTIVNVALPVIQSDLKTSFSNLEWVISAYTLVFPVVLITSSRLGDIFGRKTLFILGLAVFTLGSLLCGLSSDFTIGSLSHITILNISRGIQGLGASAMMPLSLAIISATFTSVRLRKLPALHLSMRRVKLLRLLR